MDNKSYLSTKATHAEKCVIGSIMLDELCLDVAMEIIKPSDFYTRVAEVIFSAMCALREGGKPINLATILSIVATNDIFINHRGIEYISTSQTELPNASQIEHFCSIVRSESLKRKVLLFAENMKKIEWSAIDDVDAEISKISESLLNMTSSTSVQPWSDFKSAISAACEELMSDEVKNLKTGFIDLDSKLTGLKPGSLTIVAARPAMGKTAFGLNILTHTALTLGESVAFFSLEMTTVELTNRILSSMASINGNAIRQKKMSEEEWERLLTVAEKYREAQIFIDETPSVDISVLRERARRMHRQFGIGLIIVDYLQLMKADHKKVLNREQEVATISRGLKGLAKELKIPVIALAQLNRALDSRADKHPILSDLRESGSIEQDSDNILFIHREDYYRQDEQKDNTAEIIIAKQRSGPTGIVKLHWNGECTKFSNLEHYYD